MEATTDIAVSTPGGCPVQAATAVMGGKWKPGLLYGLRGRRLRFGELRRAVPWIGERVLIRALRELEADGVVARTDHGTVPPRVDYALTPYGETLVPVLDAMAAWGRAHLDRGAAG